MVMALPGGLGISGKTGNVPRVHALAHQWGYMPATDYWFFPNTDYLTASSPNLLSAVGWIVNGTVSFVAGSGADFLGGFVPGTPDMGTPAHFLCNATGERLTSPFIFNSYEHRYFINRTLGWMPTKLIAEFFAVWTTASNADTTGGIGFVEAGGAIQTAADHFAMLTSDGTNFILRSGAVTTTATLAVDNNPHIWRIELNVLNGNATFKQDGVAIGTTTTGVVALEADLSPNAFGVAVTSSNVIGLGTTHLWYE